MPNDTQYGHPLFLESFASGASVGRLPRIQLSKNSVESTPYREAWLQNLIMDHPSILPVDQIEPAFTDLIPICEELPMRSSGFLDGLLVTPKGDIALIECKLWRNPEARREVVAQIIDYAKELSSWSYDELQRAISATRPLQRNGLKRDRTLYQEVVLARGETDEAAFHDAVSRNLRRGRFLLLIVGDGIREGVEAMIEFLQQYAGLHFTLAIVEIAVFELPKQGYIAQPRVLAKTTNIERGIVLLQEDRVVIQPPNAGTAKGAISARPKSITEERYFEELESHFPGISRELSAFIEDLRTCNVVPEFGSDSMILRWRPDGTKSWNLATITTTGQVWMDYLGQQANNAGLLDASKRYLEELAALVPGAYVKTTKKETAWNVAHDGKSIMVSELLADQTRRHGWIRAIENFQKTVLEASQGD